jgi:hypothetical protein
MTTPLSKIPNAKHKTSDTTVAVILTICSSSSYDNVFRSTPQRAEEGAKIVVYGTSPTAYQSIMDAYAGVEVSEMFTQLVKDMKSVHPESVVINWECCGGFRDASFAVNSKDTFTFIKFCLDQGFMTIFSDFSLKALIGLWDTTILGPNPFKKAGEMSGNFKMLFDKETLRMCPSVQLQVVANLTDREDLTIHCMGGTIVYTVDPTKLNHDHYDLKILSIAQPQNTTTYPYHTHSVKEGGEKGQVGHTMLTFPPVGDNPSGHMLTSCGHWCELFNIDATFEHVIEVAIQEFGPKYAMEVEKQLGDVRPELHAALYRQLAKDFIKQTPPCMYKRLTKTGAELAEEEKEADAKMIAELQASIEILETEVNAKRKVRLRKELEELNMEIASLEA